MLCWKWSLRPAWSLPGFPLQKSSPRIRLRSALWISEVIHSRNQSRCAGKESGSKLQNQTAWCYWSFWFPVHAVRLSCLLSRKQQKITTHWMSVCSWAQKKKVLGFQQKPCLNTESRCLWTLSDLMYMKSLKEMLGTRWKKCDHCLCLSWEKRCIFFFSFQGSVRKDRLCILEHGQNLVRTNTHRDFRSWLRDHIWLHKTYVESLLKENTRLCPELWNRTLWDEL